MTILLKISNYFEVTIITTCAYFIIFSDVEIHITDLTKMIFNGNSVRAVPVQPLYVSTTCEAFLMHVYLRVDCAMHLFIINLAQWN